MTIRVFVSFSRPFDYQKTCGHYAQPPQPATLTQAKTMNSDEGIRAGFKSARKKCRGRMWGGTRQKNHEIGNMLVLGF